MDFLHFGSDAYWLGHYNRSGPGPGQTAFVPTTPQQQFGPGALEGHGYYSRMAGRFVWVRLDHMCTQNSHSPEADSAVFWPARA